MSDIMTLLGKILSSRYGKDVRQSIHDAIHQCYEDGKVGATDLIAREQIANLVANVPEGGEKDSELVDIRVGYDGSLYTSAGEAVRKQLEELFGYTQEYFIYEESMFEIGAKSAFGSGTTTTTRNRVTHKEKTVTFKRDIAIVPSESVKLFVYYSDNTKSGWLEKEFVFKKNETYTYVFSYRDDRDITDVQELLNEFKCYTDLQYFIKKNYNSISGKIISILGDSISTFIGYTYPGNRCRYPQEDLLTDVNFTYWKKIINEFNLELGINDSWAGSRITWDGTTESSDIGIDKHISSLTRINHLKENGNPNIILVYAGTNDLGGNVELGYFDNEIYDINGYDDLLNLPVDTIANAFKTMLTRLKYLYKESTIIVLSPNYTVSYYTKKDLDACVEVMEKISSFFGVIFLDLRKCGMNIYDLSRYLPDGIHPNEIGMDNIYHILRTVLKNARGLIKSHL